MLDKEQKASFRKDIGIILERFRLEKGMSRRELGEALGYSGNSAMQVVARFESGRAGVPKAKIDRLLDILEIKNSDFGIKSSRSLKSFIATGGFFGPAGKMFGSAIVDMMDAGEAEAVKQMISDDEEESTRETSKTTDKKDGSGYTNVARLMKMYRIKNKAQEHSLMEQLDLIDSLSGGDGQKFVDMMLILEISPDKAYQAVEDALTKILGSND